MKKISFIVLITCLFCGCGQDIRRAITSQLADFPASRTQDIYKNFCQDNLGPGHLIPDPESARAYLLSELAEYRADLDGGSYSVPDRLYFPTGDRGNYVRVDLSVVLDSLVTEEELLDAFTRSANEGWRASPEAWTAKWQRVARVLRRDFPDIPGLEQDLRQIDSLMARGDFILHHSPEYSEAYHPHYRIVANEIFRQLPLLGKVSP